MILNLPRFVAAERDCWSELEALLDRLHDEPNWRMSVSEVQRLQYLYERSAADLVRLDEFSQPELRASLQALVARGYSTIHETRSFRASSRWRIWLTEPARAFRRHGAALGLSLAITVLGSAFGWVAIRSDSRSKAVLMPFPGLMESPGERVAAEESAKTDRLQGQKASFSATLMTHNIRASIFTLACGMTWGVGTVLLLFYNGVILGAVAADYIGAGQTPFLLGWLLPHGSFEIPAILIAGQAGFLLASALIGWGRPVSLADRLRGVRHDVIALAAGFAVMLIWAGTVEAFISQSHRPVLPYGAKITFGVLEASALTAYLLLAGRTRK
jgi:uncharacterized membrane protein SpoIIM required for sporulation